MEWIGASNIESKDYVCGHCGKSIASQLGYTGREVSRAHAQVSYYWYIYICHFCSKPTFFNHRGGQFPGSIYGESVESTPESIKDLYDETKKSYGSGAYTASVLCCRKLLMNIAVSKGAEQGKNFTYYVQYLADEHYIPPNSVEWVDIIRSKGNEANHEIKIMTREDAEQLITFSEMLLKVIYEYPAQAKKRFLSQDNNQLL